MTNNNLPRLCIFCKTGVLEPGKATFMADKNGTVLVVREVPALVCDQCGEESFEAEIADKLLKLAENASKKGVEVEILNYTAA